MKEALPSVRAPAALVSGREEDAGETEYVASLMPNATAHVLEGRAGIAGEPFLTILRDLCGVRPTPVPGTVLSTVLFTDIVDSTARQASLGDQAWKALVLTHHGVVRRALARWGGVENDTAGDGFYATFDGPARAIRCALEISEQVHDLGIEIRAGVHTGDCEVIEQKCGGLTVSIGSRIASSAGPSQVMVSQTVRDLVAGSGFAFEHAGEHRLKGVPGRWRLHRVTG